MRARLLVVSMCVVLLSSSALAQSRASGAGPTAAAPEKAKATWAQTQLDALKGLAGTWSGTATHGAESFPTTVEYRVTAGGSAVLETLFGGTPHEMVTVYHLDGDDLVLTHYCSAGNQPTMRAIRGTDVSTVSFEFVRGSNMKPADMHMHAARLTRQDADHLVGEWTSWKDGKAAGVAKFDVTRKR